MRLLLFVILSTISMDQAVAANSNGYTFTAGFRQPLLILTVDDDGTEPLSGTVHEIEYQPEVPTIGVVGMAYKGFSASYSHNLDGEDESQLDYTDYRLGLFFEHFGIDAAYTEFLNFEITHSAGFDTALDPKDAERLDMASRFAAVDLYWFPLAAGYDLAGSIEPSRKKKTGIGAGIVASYTETEIDAPGGLVPPSWQTDFGEDGAFESGHLLSTNLQAAIGATLAPGGWFVTAMIAYGAGSQTFAYDTNTQTRTGEGDADKDNYRLGLGYSGDRVFGAAQYVVESPRYILRHMSISQESSDLSLVFGMKF